MQNFTIFLKNFFSLVIRWLIIGSVALSVFLGGLFAVAQTTNEGGEFGKILNKILANSNWQQSDGTVKNAQKLWNISANEYQKISPNSKKECDPGMCMVGFNDKNEILCR